MNILSKLLKIKKGSIAQILIIYGHLNKNRKLQLFILLISSIFSAFSEVFSIAALIPFLGILSEPSKIWNYPITQYWVKVFDITSSQELTFIISFIFCITIIISTIIRLNNLWLINIISAKIGSELSCKAYYKTLYQPYIVHVNRNSSSVINSLNTNIRETINVITSTLTFLTNIIFCLIITVSIFLFNWKIAFFSFVLLIFSYTSLAFSVRKKLKRYSSIISNSGEKQVKVVQEGLGAIRDVILDGSQEIYLNAYRKAEFPLRYSRGKAQFISLFPRYAFESFGIVVIAFLATILINNGNNEIGIVPFLGSLALCAQKLLPAYQQIYLNWSFIRYSEDAVWSVIELLEQPINKELLKKKISAFSIKDSIQLSKVSFSYESKKKVIINDINLKISKGDRLGIIGKTGSGKSTLVDIIMGLLKPENGSLEIDGINIFDDKKTDMLLRWRASVGHVPQNIFLSDATITENIAFGIPRNKVDLSKVKYCINKAQLDDLIQDLPDKENTFIGEKGIKLSGGQRQRIGIARALYKNTSVLVLDEATSALDNATELAFMNAIDNLRKDLIIITIAHRLSSLIKCDKIIEISKGKIIKSFSQKNY